MMYIFLQEGMEGLMSFLPFIGILAVMYFFFMRPQLKRQKQEKTFQETLKTGTRVVTTSGIHGKIAMVNTDGSIVLETGAGKITFERVAISREYTVARFPEAEEKVK